MKVKFITAIREGNYSFRSTDPEFYKEVVLEHPPVNGVWYCDSEEWEVEAESISYNVDSGEYQVGVEQGILCGITNNDGSGDELSMDEAVKEYQRIGWTLSRWVKRQDDGSLKDVANLRN